jgi:hypothetical protein
MKDGRREDSMRQKQRRKEREGKELPAIVVAGVDLIVLFVVEESRDIF